MKTVLITIYDISILALLVTGIIYSFRYRRQSDPKQRGLYNARMNICLGGALALLSAGMLFPSPGSNPRLIIGVIFLLLGLFNLFAGLRNHAYFSR